jgi:hypothetical protein
MDSPDGNPHYAQLTVDDVDAILTEERERCARVLERRVTDIAEEHGDYEPDTNVTNLPEWLESVCEELEDQAKAIRRG